MTQIINRMVSEFSPYRPCSEGLLAKILDEESCNFPGVARVASSLHHHTPPLKYHNISIVFNPGATHQEIRNVTLNYLQRATAPVFEDLTLKFTLQHKKSTFSHYSDNRKSGRILDRFG